MAKIDVISMFFESFELIRAHYKEVIIPLVLLLLMFGSANVGTSPLYRMLSPLGAGLLTGHFTSSFTSFPMHHAITLLPFAGAALLGFMAAVIIIAFALLVLQQSLTFYVYSHFYSLLCKKKIKSDWEERMKKYAIKSVVLLLFWFIVTMILIALSLLVISLGNLLYLVIGAIIVIFLLLSVGFYGLPLWIYYVLDGLPFSTSLSKSFWLVKRNAMPFTLFCLLLIVLDVAVAVASVASCCLSFIVAPILAVLLSLLSSITIMKMKLALEK